jgi:hypothetical protein
MHTWAFLTPLHHLSAYYLLNVPSIKSGLVYPHHVTGEETEADEVNLPLSLLTCSCSFVHSNLRAPTVYQVLSSKW